MKKLLAASLICLAALAVVVWRRAGRHELSGYVPGVEPRLGEGMRKILAV